MTSVKDILETLASDADLGTEGRQLLARRALDILTTPNVVRVQIVDYAAMWNYYGGHTTSQALGWTNQAMKITDTVCVSYIPATDQFIIVEVN